MFLIKCKILKDVYLQDKLNFSNVQGQSEVRECVFFLVFQLLRYINQICTDVELTHLTKKMFEKAMKFLLLFMGQPHTGGHLISCRGMDTTCQH